MSVATWAVALAGASALPSVVDSLVRVALAAASTARRREPATPAGACLVLIPARDEGDRLSPTLLSVRDALRPGDAAILLLDGPDAEARAAAEEIGIDVAEKSPAGPTKAAALAWLVAEHRARIETFESVMVVDAGSQPAPGLFQHLAWPEGCDALQARLAGSGSGVGEAAALSERHAQRWEDVGRNAFAWNASLRGTGMLLRTATFIEHVPRLVTKVEDWELTLLIGAAGGRIALAAEEAIVTDVKPADVASAAGQRARWLVGQASLLRKHPRELARYIRRAPAEGTAFVAALFSKPRSLGVLLRLLAGTAALVGLPPAVSVPAAAVFFASVALDLGLLLLAGRAGIRPVMLLVLAWLRAVALVPRAISRWSGGPKR